MWKNIDPRVNMSWGSKYHIIVKKRDDYGMLDMNPVFTYKV